MSSKINIFVTTANFRHFVSFRQKNEILWSVLIYLHYVCDSAEIFLQDFCKLVFDMSTQPESNCVKDTQDKMISDIRQKNTYNRKRCSVIHSESACSK